MILNLNFNPLPLPTASCLSFRHFVRRNTREMSEAKEKKTWCELLPPLYNLLVENADGIIDDTSLQRLLEWLKNVCRNDQQVQKLLECGTVEFMSKEHVFSNPESSAFFLSLFGFLVAKEEMFHSFKCGEDGDFAAQFLDKPRTDSNLWNEGIVRNGYFQALSSLTEHKDGILWLRDTGRNLLWSIFESMARKTMFKEMNVAKYRPLHIPVGGGGGGVSAGIN